MSPSAVNGTGSERIVDERPLKRARKGSSVSEQAQSPQTSYAGPSQVDHIFISEENLSSSKKAGKKNPLSCCECRRLKLKCDRTFPCGSCRKRGVSDICPDGVLVSGKGTRFILANTEQLHSKIHDMSEHIRRLEEALDHSTGGQHPLLQPDMLNMKSTMELYKTQPGKPETSPSISTHRHHERSPPTEHHDSHTSSKIQVKLEHSDQLEAEIQRLGNAFPMADNRSPEESNLRLREYIRSKLPSRTEAEYLWEQTMQNALWQYNPHNEEVFFTNLTHHCYESSVEELSSRRLALLFMILAIGCLVDLNKRDPESPEAEQYHILGRAALCEVSVMEDTTVETITALFYEIWYLLVFSDNKKGSGHAWGLMGLTAKLAQSIGLHRNGTKAKVIPEEVERRRSLYWELLYLDARLSLSLGRPPSLSSKYMDCKRPIYVTHYDNGPLESPHYYQEWKHSCYVDCLAPVLDAISQPGLEYTTVIELDKKIRDFHIPSPLQARRPPSRTMMMQKASLTIALETVLLQLHRSYFIRALSHPEEPFNRRHRHAPSVVAIFLSASRMISTVQEMYLSESRLTTRILGYWSNAFSAAIALCLLASRAPFTCMTPAILQELERARRLFHSAADTCPRAKQMIPMLEAMIAKANDIFRRWYYGQEVPTMVFRHTDDFADSDFTGLGTPPYVPQPGSPTTSDPFMFTHSDLRRCITEAHDRAKVMLPMRKPCQCSVQAQQAAACPPSHSWEPPPPVETSIPVLPALQPEIANPLGFTTASPASAAQNVGHSDNINFELGALHPNSEQTWMAWF